VLPPAATFVTAAMVGAALLMEFAAVTAILMTKVIASEVVVLPLVI
jgi:hypothetical protein